MPSKTLITSFMSNLMWGTLAHASTETLTCRQVEAGMEQGDQGRSLPVDDVASTVLIYDKARLVVTYHNGKPFNYGCNPTTGGLDCARPNDTVLITDDRTSMVRRFQYPPMGGKAGAQLIGWYKCSPL
jgi:hypothetical protein